MKPFPSRVIISRFWPASWLVLGLAASVGLRAAQTKPATLKGAPLKISGGFSAPVFEGSELKTQFEGDSMVSAGENRLLVNKFRLKTFQPGRVLDLLAEADECYFLQGQNIASSAGPLKVKKMDGRMSLEGRGFEWRQQDLRLYISNDVHTVLRIDSTNSRPANPGASLPTNAAPVQIQNLDVFSDYFEYDAKANVAIYRGHVRAADGQRLRLSCDLLTAGLPAAGKSFESIVADGSVTLDLKDEGVEHHASGDKATYVGGTASAERIEITGNARWKTRQYEGQGDWLALTSRGKNFAFQVKDRAMVRFPASLMERTNFLTTATRDAGGTTNGFVEVSANEYEFKDNTVSFKGNVRADSPAGWNLVAGRLTVKTLAGTNRVERILAEEAVAFQFLQGTNQTRATGDRAEFDANSGNLAMSGKPVVWRARQYEGAGEQLTFNTRQKEMDYAVRGHAFLKLPAGAGNQFQNVFPGVSIATNTSAKTNRFVEIRSDEYTMKSRVLVFLGQVRASYPPGELTCGRLTARLGEGEGKLEEIVAEDHAVAAQNDARLTAGKFTARFAPGTNRLSSFMAEQTVEYSHGEGKERIIGGGERADYTGTDGIMRLTGSPRLQTGRGAFRADHEIIWDTINQRVRAKEYRMEGTGAALRKSAPPSSAKP